MTDDQPELAAPRHWRLADAAAHVAVSVSTLRRAIRAGELVAYQFAGRTVIDDAELARWVLANRRPGGAGFQHKPKR